jgi:hypothetical protein
LKPLRVLLAALIGAALALPSMALAASPSSNPVIAPPQSTNPLSPGFPQPSVSIPSTTPTVAPTISTAPTAGSGSAFSGSSAVIIAIGALVVLGGISFFIWRDARRRAPTRVRPAAATAGEGRRQGSKTRTKPRKLSPAERRRRKRGRAR